MINRESLLAIREKISRIKVRIKRTHISHVRLAAQSSSAMMNDSFIAQALLLTYTEILHRTNITFTKRLI